MSCAEKLSTRKEEEQETKTHLQIAVLSALLPAHPPTLLSELEKLLPAQGEAVDLVNVQSEIDLLILVAKGEREERETTYELKQCGGR
jgi:hypothetical protein